MDVTRFRGAHRFEPGELQTHVLHLLQHEAALRGVSDRELRVSTAQLLNLGIGMRPTTGPGEGYRQVLALFGATLLKYAGAKEPAIEAEVGSRDQSRLEGLVRAVRTRLAQLAEQGEPGGAAPSADVFEHTPTEAAPAPVVSVAGMASPFLESTGPSATPTTDNPALAFVKARITPEVLTFVNTAPPMDGQLQVSPDPRLATGDHVVPPAVRRAQAVDVSDNQSVEITPAPGVVVRMTPSAVLRYRDPAQRAALIRTLALELEQIILEAQ